MFGDEVAAVGIDLDEPGDGALLGCTVASGRPGHGHHRRRRQARGASRAGRVASTSGPWATSDPNPPMPAEVVTPAGIHGLRVMRG